jgi:transposase
MSKHLSDILRRIASGDLKRYEAAAELGVSERQVNRYMRRYNVARPKGRVPDLRAQAKKRREAKEAAAKKAVAGQLSVEAAAKQADVSVRTMYRWVEKLRK